MMRIEAINVDKVVLSGSYLLKALMNKSTPILDLLVRESIQNSLDAALPNAENVQVDYKTGVFEKSKLNSEFEGLSVSLNEVYPDNEYDYLAIRDTNTFGLTGNVDPQTFEKGKDRGNFYKLVYSLGQAQTAEGAGGSWGVGKTIYYRIGNGLVIYYSRIKNSDNGFESRMAACMVEDETKTNLTPSPCGIAFWGGPTDHGKTVPLRDETSITRILKIFGIDPYEGNKTGTTIIIPYIQKEKLLNNNSNKTEEDNNGRYYWTNDIDSYLEIAAQRWYFPRLNNRHYPHGKPLKVLINGNMITKDNMVPLFKIYQSLYNRAATNEIFDDDYLQEMRINTGEDIFLKKTIIIQNSLENTTSGRLIAIKVKADDLGMNRGYRKPYDYAQQTGEEDDKNLPLMAFCRKPGMIVAYRTSGHWVKGVSSTEQNEYLCAIFVLNSDNMLKHPRISLEEYIRHSEHGDHFSWEDYSYEGYPKDNIIDRIKDGVKRQLATQYNIEPVIDTEGSDEGIGYKMRKLLPTLGFGTRPSGRIKSRDGEKKVSTQKSNHISYGLDPNRTKFGKDNITVTYLVSTSDPVIGFVMKCLISTTGSEHDALDCSEWEETMPAAFPLDITSVVVSIKKRNNEKESIVCSADSNNPDYSDNDLTLSLKPSSRGTYTEIGLSFPQKCSFDLSVSIIMGIKTRHVLPFYSLKELKEKEITV